MFHRSLCSCSIALGRAQGKVGRASTPRRRRAPSFPRDPLPCLQGAGLQAWQGENGWLGEVIPGGADKGGPAMKAGASPVRHGRAAVAYLAKTGRTCRINRSSMLVEQTWEFGHEETVANPREGRCEGI